MSESHLQQAHDIIAAQENYLRMQQVVQQMKEIPILPSEAPKDVQGLEKVEFPAEGGVLTYMVGNTVPYRGFPYYEFVDRIDLIKKVARATLSGLYHELKKSYKLSFLTLLPAFWFFKKLVNANIYTFYRVVERFRIKKNMYSLATQELYRAFSVENPSEKGSTRELRYYLRDLVCMVLEFDNAYRFRFQDICEDLNQEALKKNPIKELTRLLTIMQGREMGQDIKDTWTLLKLFCNLYLRFNKELRSIIVDTLCNLEITKVLLTPEDKFYCPFRKDFQPKFLKGLRETPIRKLSPAQKKDRFYVEMAVLDKGRFEAKSRLVDATNSKAAVLREEYGKKSGKENEELEKSRAELEQKRLAIEAEANQMVSFYNQISHVVTQIPESEAVAQAIGDQLQGRVALFQANFNELSKKVASVNKRRSGKIGSYNKKLERELKTLNAAHEAAFKQIDDDYEIAVARLKKLLL